jgi:hypothetical protein
MHNDDTQDLDNLAHLVHNPRRDPVHLVHNTRRDPRNRYHYKCSRDRNRRT